MKRWKLMLAAAVVGSVALGVRAEEKRITYFGQIEYLTYSDAFEEKEGAVNKRFNQFRDQLLVPEETMNTETDTTNGLGFRLGALTRTSIKGLTIGGSLGYILGPSFEGNLDSTFDDGVDVGTIKENWETKSNIWRLMAETKYSVPMGEKFQARLGFGLGFAKLNIKDTYSRDLTGVDIGFYGDPTYPDYPYQASYDKSMSTTKFTWEIGPAIAYVGESIGVELALTYSQLPSAEDMNTFQEFDWNPFGIRLGVEF